MKIKKYKKELFLILGSLLIAVSFSYILYPNNLMGGNFLNILVLFKSVFGKNIIYISYVLFMLLTLFLNKTQRKKHMIALSVIYYFIFIFQFFPFIISVDTFFFNSLISGVLLGLGFGLIAKSEYLIIIDNKVVIILNILLILSSIFFFNLEIFVNNLILYCIVLYFREKIIFGFNTSKIFYILSNKHEQIYKYIYSNLSKEVTYIKASGMKTNENNILFAVIDSDKYIVLKEYINKIDSKAFVTVCDAYEVINKDEIKK